jgi:uncharacterized protein (UPF0264 family)
VPLVKLGVNLPWLKVSAERVASTEKEKKAAVGVVPNPGAVPYVAANAVAPSNMFVKFVTLLTSQPRIS